MAFEPKPNSGVLKVNKKRTEENNQPHLRGILNQTDGDYWISAWKKEDKNGDFMLSLATTPIEKVNPGADLNPKPKPELTPGGLPKINAEDLPF